MANQFETDLGRATEIVLTRRNRVRRTGEGPGAGAARRAMSGSAGRAAAGAVSVGSALGAALTGRRVLGPAEGGLLAKVGLAILVLAAIAAVWPHVVAWPAAALGAWLGLAWLAKAIALRKGNGQGGRSRATAGRERRWRRCTLGCYNPRLAPVAQLD